MKIQVPLFVGKCSYFVSNEYEYGTGTKVNHQPTLTVGTQQ